MLLYKACSQPFVAHMSSRLALKLLMIASVKTENKIRTPTTILKILKMCRRDLLHVL